ncbi:dihydroxyacetone kinase phosphoryl donor subunit DhaM [Trueperella bialowiezensis]|uniref:Phosphocarrier protein HPr n=1 Tax=Trueperella bialowiezensis TaxID=312285 RepID=A0A3S4UZK4_9ACTO|nr:dihydroxyacetone kinase phosphoryl donor subunit DhaM [Trueperella bialowiezensis]VEI13660.1 Phosphoenolpyruvate-protein phosphotransferase [Trueperella bialowiezensis]
MANVGLVAVSHSAPLAQAACDLALDMGRDANVIAAGGTGEEGFGTNAELIAAAIEQADSGVGVVVLVDLGSAVMSTDIALEFIDPDIAERTTVVPAPLVEGLVVAAVAASAGAERAVVAREAMGALAAKAADIPYSDPAAPDVANAAAGTAPGGEPSGCELAGSEPATSKPSASEPPAEEEWESRRFVVDDPAGLHARPAAALVAAVAPFDAQVRVALESAGRGPNPADSMTALISLGVQEGDEILVQAAGPDALAALDAVGELARRGWVKQGADKPKVSTIPAHQRQVASGMEIAVGPALVWRAKPRTDTTHTAGNQLEAFHSAREAVRTYLHSLADTPLLALQLGLLDDPAYIGNVTKRIDTGVPAEIAIRAATNEMAASYADLPTHYLRERGDDVVALGELLILALHGQPLGGLANAVADYGRAPIVVVESLTPALASEIETGTVMGIVAATGSITGHGALIAAAKGIPVVAGKPEARDINDGDEVAIEPRGATLTVNPSRAELRELLRASKEQQRFDEVALAHAHKPATFAGHTVTVCANVAMVDDAALGARNGADGSGLVRTEVLFADDDVAPTIDRQASTFLDIARAIGTDKPITIRTWDVGADKPVSFFTAEPEENPFLGVRGIRLMRRYPQALVDQFCAIIKAAQEANIQVMVPMITCVDELRWARERFDEAVALEGNPQVLPKFGMMLETPAAILRVKDFAELVDFVSVGTNDLIQYLAAADRGNAGVAGLASAVVPLVVDLIADVARELDVPVSVCGDLASSETHVPALLRAGVRGLSVRPGLVPRIKQAVRSADSSS